jgi:hypothetical protein
MSVRGIVVCGLLGCLAAACGGAAEGGEGTHPVPTNPALRTPDERGVTEPHGTPPGPPTNLEPPPDPRLVRARDAFMEGVRLYEAGSYGDALQQFSAAYELAPRSEILFNIAACQEHLGDIRGAVVTYQRCLAGADVPADMQQQVREKIRALESQLGIER